VPAEKIIIKLDPLECRQLLSRARIGRVALSIDALPAVRTVKFALADNDVLFRVAPTSRLRRAATGAVVAFHADHYDEQAGEGWTVLVRGMCEEISNVHAAAELASLQLEPWANTPTGDVLMRVPMSMISGERVQWVTT